MTTPVPSAGRSPGAAESGLRAAGPPPPGGPGRRRAGAARVLAGVGVLLALAACGTGTRAGSVPAGAPGPTAGPGTASLAEASPGTASPAEASPGATARRNRDVPWGPATAPQSPAAPPTARAAAATRPLSVAIPSIGVRSSLVPLALLPGSGELEAPVDFDRAGWYAAGPTPGEPGPAVIAGHVDSRRGPAVFFRLRELRPGDAVQVTRSDGVTARFAVTGVERYPKAEFPTQRVHGPTPDRALRLITCGGSFDPARRSYRDNVVVYAVRTG